MISQRTKVTIVAIDGEGKSSLTRAWLPVGIDLAAAQSAAATLVDRIRALSDAQIAQFSVAYALRTDATIVPRTTLLSTPLAIFSFALTDMPDTYETLITPLDPTWVLADGPLAGLGIDLANTEVASLTDAITSGGWTDPFGNDIGAIYSAFISEAE